MTDEAGRNAGDKATLRHDAGFDVVELQASVVTHHLAWRGGGWRGWVEKKDKNEKKREHCLTLTQKG